MHPERTEQNASAVRTGAYRYVHVSLCAQTPSFTSTLDAVTGYMISDHIRGL